MALVMGVHGIFQEQRGRQQLLDEWKAGLVDGVEAAAGRSAVSPSLDICFYGGLFLPAAAQGARLPAGKGAAAAGVLDIPVMADDMAFLEAAASEVESAPVFAELPPAMGVPRVPAALHPLVQRLTRRLDGALALQFISVLRQVKIYLNDEALADQIRGRFLKCLHDDQPRVVIAHSLGSVVAVDALRLNPAANVPMLITVGSPLGMQAVRARLRHPAVDATAGEFANVSRWLNILDPGDPVAAAGGLSRIWPAVEDYTVGNGRDPHGILGYLGKRVTGQAVLAGVTG